ncbi:histone-lysine N-methyltransferase, H3 lysine-79 specific isoform X23 [Wyeomyia smithii]|uniref:histone-lysine N-methyltransferase, H3 lysine-79 specific isoform X23 n=1 Tax=Wyeomyia smithii TaxID=174621 RepID=UPI002467F298|nr:histone-lysine N-methyltransferase, H3 lysine-79 specific isoform X23 [Wyeomyia smithii]
MISVKRCAATNISASHHHHQHHAHHHNQPHSQGNPNSSTTVQIRSSSAGRAASNNSAGSGSSNNNRLIRSRNSYQHIGGSGVAYTNGGYSSGGLSGGGPTNGFSSLLTNGSSGSLYHSTSNNSVLGSKSRNIGGDIYEFDSLFLVPKCALTYDKAMSLRKDLAAYDFNIRILEDTPKGNVWISGNRDANAQKQTRPSSANKDSRRRHSVAHTLHWFACVGEDIDINGFNDEEEQQKEREERIKQIKERQNEERQRKLEELKAQALAAQKFREQKEEERRRRMEDLRRRENDRRSQVEERRRAIQEADNERRQYILQKNQEREQRMETKRRNERSSIAFAFGSSTPRMIDTGDSGMSSSFWTNRRATSITNVAYTGAPLTRRSSERELPDGNSKKRATSASGLDRSTDDMRRMSSSMYEVFNWAQTSECPKKLTLSLAGAGINIDEPPSSAERAAAASARRDDSADMSYQRTVNRRKTDLMPTIPSPRDSSRSSLGTHTPRTPEKPPLPKISAASSGTSGGTSVERKRSQSGTSTPVRVAPAVDSATKKHSSAEKVRISSARGTPKASSTPLQSPGPDKTNRTLNDSLQQKTQKPKPKVDESSLVALQQGQTLVKQGSSVSAKSAEENTETVEQKQEQVLIQSETVSVSTTVVETAEQQQTIVTEIKTEEVQIDSAMEEHQPQLKSLEISNHEEKQDETKEANLLEPDQNGDGSTNDLMTASMIAKRITTEEEAKAALAERRRQAREEAERQAELERQRVAAEEAAEIQRQLEEEERLRKLEEETIRLAEEQRRLDEERLQQAIEEAKKRDEEERLRREEEARQKAEREESERKAREEAERQRVEMAERLKKEEKEREERRKRVEAIMSRTRAKGSANNTPTKQSDENKDDVMSKSQIVTSDNPAALLDPTMSMTESMLGSTDPQPSETDVAFPVPAEAPTSDKVDQLAQDVQSLSLVDVGSEVNQQNNNNNNNNSSSLNNNHNNNNDRNEESVAVSNSGKSNSSADYERSVTEKENFLLGSFNNNLNSNGGSGIGSSQQPSSLESSSSPVGATTNGKSTSGATTIAETTELIIEDAIMSGQTNGHKNGSIDNVFTQDLPAVDSATKPFLVTFDTSSPSATATAVDFTLSSAADVVAEQNNENHNLLDSTTFTNVTTTTATTAGQLIDFGSFQSSLADEVPQQQSATVLASDDPFNLNLNNNNNFSDHLLINSSNNGTSASPSLFTTGDANLISSSNFLNNNSARLVAASDSQDNRDLSLL